MKTGTFKRSIALTVALATALGAATVLAAVSARPAAALPPLFQDTTVFSGRYEPTTIQFAPDGKVFVTEKSGRIYRYDSISDPTAHLVADLRTEVYDYWDRGLLGLAVDPNFGPARPYIYVQYSYDHMLGDASPAPKWGPGDGTNDSCASPTVNGCVTSGRVSKLTLSAVDGTVTNEQVLVEDWCGQYPSHSIGTVAFGADGMLYAGGGDGADFNTTDYGQSTGGNGVAANPCGDPPGGVGHANSVPSAQGGALRAQAERLGAKESASVNGGKTTLDGSIIRIDPDTGLGVSGNPLFNTAGADANEKRMVAYGLRNPFRFSFKAGTNDIWLGDVGWDTWEEINTIPDPTTSGPLKDFGWPCYEGVGHQPGYDSLNLTACNNLYAAGTSAVQAPYYTYNHAANVVAGDNCPTGSSDATGEAYYNPPTGPGASPYPAKYSGALFFTDYVRKCIWAMLPGTNGKPNPNNVELFANIADPTSPNRSTGAVDLVESTTGDLYYVSLDTGEIHRISYTAANHPPVASFTATPSFGAAPLNVTFNASASSDPDAGDTLTYAWDLDGNGVYNDATGVSTSRTYAAGNVTVGLQVTDSHGATATTTRLITPGNTPPTATITAPSAALTWKVGDPIAFSGSATDTQSGALPASSLSWNVDLLTCDAAGSNCVVRSNQPFNGTSGSTVTAPDWSGEGNTLLEFSLTATDPGGLTDTKTVRLTPQKSTLTFQSNPTGLSLGYGSTVGTTPFTRTVIVGANTSISAPSPQSLGANSYQFTSWSDGGAASHNLTVPATATTYTATYTNVGPANLVAAYGFEAGSGTSVLDSSGVGNNGMAANTTWSTAGKFGKALSFNGTNALVTVPDADSLDLTTGMTLEAWVNPTAAPAWGAVVAKETTGDQNYGVFATAGAGFPAGAIISGSSIFTAAGNAAAALNTWTHVATTYDGTNLRYYQNGVLVKTTAHSGAINVTTGVLHIGGDSSVDMFKGLIDEVRVYNTALSAAQITTDMNTPVVPVVTDTTPPGAPGTLSATGGLGGANLSWGAATDNVGVAKYDVYRSTTSGFTPSVANRVAQPTGLTYNDTGLAASTYYYRVAAEDAAGNVGPPTNEASAVVTADTTAPTVALTSPAAGTVSGAVTVSATANDNVAVAGVQFKVDGTTNIGAEDTTAPYSVSWASTGVTNGTHTLTAVARDAAGNTTTSTPVTVTVNNTGPAGLVAAYGFNAGSGTTAADSSGNNNNGTTANTTWSTAGKFGNALSFNGTNALVTVPDANSLDLTTGMTLEAWLNPTTTGGWVDAFGKETTDDVVYSIYSSTPANRPTGYIRKGGVFSQAAAVSPMTLNNWTHLATTYDGANLRFYVNGTLISTTAATGAIDTSNGVLRIGGNSIFGEYFKGLIDEVRIYNRALSAAEITTDMNTPV
jgi:glucose/arabinose dehydrogenase